MFKVWCLHSIIQYLPPMARPTHFPWCCAGYVPWRACSRLTSIHHGFLVSLGKHPRRWTWNLRIHPFAKENHLANHHFQVQAASLRINWFINSDSTLSEITPRILAARSNTFASCSTLCSCRDWTFLVRQGRWHQRPRFPRWVFFQTRPKRMVNDSRML